MKRTNVRREREKQELRLKILEAARELFLTQGEGVVTLRKVAEKIEYSATTIYLHFPSKEALIHELCRGDFLAFSRAFKQADRASDPLDRLRKIASVYVDFGLQFPGHYRSMFLEASPSRAMELADERVHSTPATASKERSETTADQPPRAYDFLHAGVFKAMAAGCFRPEHRDVALIAQLIWSGLHGIVTLHLVRTKFAEVPWRPVQVLVDSMLDSLLHGLVKAN